MSGFENVKGIYFDLDDTLLGYWVASKKALSQTFEVASPASVSPAQMLGYWSEAFAKYQTEIKTPEWYPGYLKSGMQTRNEQMRRALALAGIVDEDRVTLLGDTYGRLRNENLVLFEDALDVLNLLQQKYHLGLITNGPADVQRQEIAQVGIEPFFDPILIEGEMGIGKPHATVFDRAENAWNLRPHEVLMVGNSFHHDIVPAMKRGWLGVWIRRETDVPPGKTSVESIPENAVTPTATVSSLTELVGLLS